LPADFAFRPVSVEAAGAVDEPAEVGGAKKLFVYPLAHRDLN
jgi:hypothetical protein